MLLGHLGEMLTSIQSLFFSGDREKDDCGRELVLAEHARTLQAYSRSGAVVVSARRIAVDVKGIAVAGIVVPGYQDDALGVFWICALQHRINISNDGWLGNAVHRLFGGGISFHFEATTTLLRVALEL